MKRLAAIALGLSSLLVLALKVTFMLGALVLVTVDEHLERLQQWLSVRSAMFAGTAIPVFEDDVDEDPELFMAEYKHVCLCFTCTEARFEAAKYSTPKE